MATYVDICNSALIRLGIPIISSFADGTKAANVCSIRYTACRDIVLRMYPWSCATKRVVLAPSTTPPAYQFTFAYPVPSDWLRTLDVCSDTRGSQAYLGSRSNYELESNQILTNFNPCYLKYVYQVDNADQLDPECQNALACYIAYDISNPLLQDANLTKVLNEEFEASMTKAMNVNAQEETACMVIDNYDRARLGPGTFYGWPYDQGIG